MPAIYALGELKQYFRPKEKANISNAIFRSNRATAVILIGCCILVSSNHFFGDPIHCMLGERAVIPPSVFDSYCFMAGLYTLPIVSSNVTEVHVGVSTGLMNAGQAEDGVVYHNYYQWVPILLALQAALFYAPWHLWKSVEGGRVGKLLYQVPKNPLTDVSVYDQMSKLSEFLLLRSGWFDSASVKLSILKMICLFSAVFQLVIMNAIIGYKFLTLGNNFMSIDLLEDYLNKVFPIVIKCSMMYIGPSGSYVNSSGMCTLPLNIINEKIYVLLWIVLMMDIFVTILFLLYDYCVMVFPFLRQFELQRHAPTLSPHLVKSVVRQSSYGDITLLLLIANNVDASQFKMLLSQLSDTLSLQQYQRGPIQESSFSIQEDNLDSISVRSRAARNMDTKSVGSKADV